MNDGNTLFHNTLKCPIIIHRYDVIIRYSRDEVIGYTILHASKRIATR
jgi:hypothetical protein